MNWNNCTHFRTGNRSRGAAHVIGMVGLGICLAALFALIFGLVVKWLWNWLMPGIFGLPVITYWQAFGLVVLAKLLFGGFGHNHFTGRHVRDRCPTHTATNGRESDTGSSPEDSRNYSRFWHEEGRAAFESWMDRIEKEQNGRRNDDYKTESKEPDSDKGEE